MCFFEPALKMMDPDFLENCGEKIVSGILLQDLTAYIDLLNPTVLLRVYQDQPPTANNTTATVNLGGTSGTTSNNNNTRAIATAPPFECAGGTNVVRH